LERHALVLALALMLPLALYGIPYAYAATMSSTYAVLQSFSASPQTEVIAQADCKPGDYLTGGGYVFNGGFQPDLKVQSSYGVLPDHGPNPTIWNFEVYNSSPSSTEGGYLQAICQSPITVAGIGVPQFGSLYVAIALGAVLYFMLSRRFARRPTITAQVKA
jgi:hypothetical protein